MTSRPAYCELEFDMSRKFVVFLVVLAMLTIATLSYTSWTATQRHHESSQRIAFLALQLSRLRLTCTTSDRKASMAVDQAKAVDKLFYECQDKQQEYTRNMKSLQDKVDEQRARITELENQLLQKASIIQKLVDPGGTLGTSNQTSTVALVAHIAKANCELWTSLANRNALNGVREYLISTLTECQNYCVKQAACVAVDFDKESTPLPSCWIHNSAQDLADKSIFSQIGTTQYRLNRTCLSG